MRLGLVAPPWIPTPPPSYGGTEHVVDLLARGLAARGHDVVLFATGDSRCPVERRWFFETPSSPISDAVSEAAHVLAAYGSMRDVDVIHDHTVLGPLLRDPARRAPVVVTNHGPFTALTNPVFAAASRTASVVAISRSHARSAAPNVRIAAVIYHGLDIETIPVGSGSGGYVAFLGRMDPAKGAHLAIDAARGAGVPIKLAAKCREPNERRYFDVAIRPRLGPDAEFLGEVGPNDKHALLGEAIALVNPIQWCEPFGLVMAEALACGTPVVTTSCGAAPEIVEHRTTGFVCRRTTELEGAITIAPNLRRDRCRQAALERFSLQRMIDDHVDLYRSVAEGVRSTTESVVPSLLTT